MVKKVCVAPVKVGRSLVEMVESLNGKYQLTFGGCVTVFAAGNYLTASEWVTNDENWRTSRGITAVGERIDDTFGHFNPRILDAVDRKKLVLYAPNDRTREELRAEGYEIEQLEY